MFPGLGGMPEGKAAPRRVGSDGHHGAWQGLPRHHGTWYLSWLGRRRWLNLVVRASVGREGAAEGSSCRGARPGPPEHRRPSVHDAAVPLAAELVSHGICAVPHSVLCLIIFTRSMFTFVFCLFRLPTSSICFHFSPSSTALAQWVQCQPYSCPPGLKH